MRYFLVILLFAATLLLYDKECSAQDYVVTRGGTTYVELNALADWTAADADIFENVGIILLRRGTQSLQINVKPQAKSKAPVAIKLGSFYYVPLKALPGPLGVSVTISSSGSVHVAFVADADAYDLSPGRLVKKNHIRISVPPMPEAVMHFRLGSKMMIERAADAIRELETAVTLSPDYADAELALATVYKAQGNKEKSLAHLRQVTTGVCLDDQRQRARSLIKSLTDHPTKLNKSVSGLASNSPVPPQRSAHPPGVVWECRDEFRDELTMAKLYTVSTLTLSPDGTGTFTLVMFSGKSDTHTLNWSLEASILKLDFHPAGGDQWRSWAAELDYSMSADDTTMTLTGKGDLRESRISTYITLSSGLFAGGQNPGYLPVPLGALDTAVYTRQ